MIRKHYIDLPEGQLHYVTAGQGAPLFLLHQSPMHSAEWDGIVPILAEKYQVFAPDLPGHGQSYDPDHELKLEDFADIIVGLIRKLGFSEVLLAGNHSGAAIATCIAVKNPGLVSRLIVSCEMLSPGDQIRAFIDMLAKQPLSREIPLDAEGEFIASAWKKYERLAPASPLEVRYKPFIIAQASRLRPYDIHHEVLDWMARDLWLEKVTCPKLVFGADRDLFYSEKMLLEAPEKMSVCETATIRDAGAFSTFEKAEELGSVMLDFFSR